MGTTPEINIDDIDPAVYKAVVAHQTRRAATRPMGGHHVSRKAQGATQRPSPGSSSRQRAKKAAQADFLNEGGE